MVEGYGNLSVAQAIRRLVTHVGVYGVGNALQRVGAFVLLPLYIARLSPEEYGLLALASILPFVLPPVLSLGLPNAITRYYHEWAREGLVARNLGTVWAIATASTLCGIVLLDQAGEAVLGPLLTQVPYQPYLRLALWWAFFTALSTCPLFLLRIQEQSVVFVVISGLSFFLGTGLNIWAVLSGGGIEGILSMQVISAACMGLVLTGWYLRQVTFHPHGPSLLRAFRFALPIVPSACLEVVASRADRFFLDKWVPLPEIGLYALANQVGQAVKFFYDSVKPAWLPFYIRVASERQDARQFLGHVVTIYAAALCVVASAVLLLAPDVVSWFEQGNRYAGAISLLPILIGSYFLHGLAPIGSSAVLVAERTHWQPIIQLVHTSAVIVANFALTQKFGLVGAAWSVFLSYGLLSVLYLLLGQRAYPVEVEVGKIFSLFAAAVFVFSFAIGLAAASLIGKMVILAAYTLFTAAVVSPGRKILRLAIRR